MADVKLNHWCYIEITETIQMGAKQMIDTKQNY